MVKQKKIDNLSFPKSWKLAKVGDLGEVLKGKGISKVEVRSTGFPCIRYGELYTTYHYHFKNTVSYIDSNSAKLSQEIVKNDILFAGSGETAEEIGKCATYLGNKKAYAGGDIIILRPKNVNGLFLGYLLNCDFVNNQKTILGQGHSVVHIYPKGIAEIVIPLPSLPEQNKIAKILSAFDKAIDKLTLLIETKEKRKKGLMQKLLTGEVRFKEFKKEKWKELKIGELLDYEQPIKYATKPNETLSNGIPVLTANKSFLLGYTNDNSGIYSKLPVIIFDDFTTDSKYVDFPFKVKSSAIKMLRPKNQNVDLKFVYEKMRMIHTNITDHKRRFISEYQSNIISMPPIKEQEKIASVLSACDNEIQKLKVKLQKLKKQKEGLMQELLTGKRRVKI